MLKKLLLALLVISTSHFSQSVSSYFNAPEEIKNNKPFQREMEFYSERAYPDNFIPKDAYIKSMQQKETLAQRGINNISWVNLGPTPGYYFAYGNISSRIVTGAYDPNDPNIIYIGAANGGIWKSTNGGMNWTPLTDDQPSMSSGALAIDPTNTNIIYAGTGEATYSGASYYGAGLLKSTNAGQSWIQYTSGLPNQTYFSRIVIRPNHPNELLAALGNSGLYRSTNSGETWTEIRSGRCDDVLFTVTGDTAFAVGGSTNLARSINGGASFSNFGSGLPNGTRTHFDIARSNSSKMYAAVYSSSSFTFYRSTNYGANWVSANSYNFNGSQAWYDMHVRVNPKNENQIFVGTIDIHRSTDGGTTFTNITNGYSGGNVHVDQHYIFFHPTDENTLFACNDGGIWRSTNGGTSFTNMNQNLTLTQFYRITASPFTPSRILGGTQDNGTQQTYSTLNWQAAFGGDGGEVCFNPFDQNYILGETQYNGIYRTTNGGATWNSSTSGLSSSEAKAWVAPIIAHPDQNGVFFTARQRVYRSSNNGGSWTAVSSNVNGTNAVRELAISKTNPNIMFATSSALVFKSTNAGASWTNVSGGLPNKTINSVYVHPNNENEVFLTFSGFGTSKVYRSTDGGNGWMNIHGNLPDSPVNDIFIYTDDPTAPQTYFAATDIGVFLTRDNGVTWEDMDNGLPNTVIKHLDYSPSTKMLRAGTHGRGVYEAFIDFTVPVELSSFTLSTKENIISLKWETSTETNNRGFEIERKFKNDDWQIIGFVNGSGTTTEKQSYAFNDDLNEKYYEGKILYRLKQIDYDGSYEYSEQVAADVSLLPQTVELLQNYPNPFNPETTIKFAIPNSSKVILNIYNSLGEKTAELLNGFRAPGIHQAVFNAEQFSSGIYYYELVVQEEATGKVFKEMKKSILMK